MAKSNITLEDAIAVVEAAGGFVMLEDMNFETEQELEERQTKEKDRFNEYLDRKKQAFKEFDQLLGRKDFSFSKVEDICYENGIDMDDIEEWIHSQY